MEKILLFLILASLLLIIIKQFKMSTQLDTLTQDVANDTVAEQSAITLLNNLSTQLKAAIASQPTDDGAALAALSTTLETNQAALAAAITANTPAATTAQ